MFLYLHIHSHQSSGLTTSVFLPMSLIVAIFNLNVNQSFATFAYFACWMHFHYIFPFKCASSECSFSSTAHTFRLLCTNSIIFHVYFEKFRTATQSIETLFNSQIVTNQLLFQSWAGCLAIHTLAQSVKWFHSNLHIDFNQFFLFTQSNWIDSTCLLLFANLIWLRFPFTITQLNSLSFHVTEMLSSFLRLYELYLFRLISIHFCN